MVSKKIYIVRHGQTDFNKNGILQGKGVNAPLNERGIGQAKAFFEAYKNEGFQFAYTSTLQRTTQSIQSFIDLGIEVSAQEGLCEISWGSSDGSVIAEFPEYMEICNKWTEGEITLKAMDGESPVEVAERQLPVIDLIKSAPYNKVLVCMHGRAIRILLCQLLGQDLIHMDDYKHHNLGLYVVNFDGEKFELETYNSTEHLEVAGLID